MGTEFSLTAHSTEADNGHSQGDEGHRSERVCGGGGALKHLEKRGGEWPCSGRSGTEL